MTETQKHVVRVAESGSGRYSQIVTAGSHTLSADEPQAVGGDDVGPSPYEYIMAGLGACTAMTLRSYVTRHNWGVGRITIELQHEKIVGTGSTSIIDQFHRVIHLEGDVSEEQRLKLLEIAETCAVSQTLRRVSNIESKLSGSFEPSPA
ncbi:MAG TPA: OsmC family protein [Pseudolabrys sp.]|nr:OsmC family protein [Pseudolabrys sp.]